MVRPTRLRNLVLVLVIVALVSWGALRLWTSAGREMPMLPWATPGVMGLLAVAVVVAGLPVRQWNRGHRSAPLDPLRAARTVVLAKSAQYAGALLAGWYAGQLLTIVPTVDVEPRRDLLVRALVAVIAALLVAAAGRLVERFCRIDRGGGRRDERGAGRRDERSRAGDDLSHGADDDHDRAERVGSEPATPTTSTSAVTPAPVATLIG